MENLRKIIWAVVSERAYSNVNDRNRVEEFLRGVNSDLAISPNMNFEMFEYLMGKYDEVLNRIGA